MDSEYEDYSLDKLLEDLKSNTPSNNAYKIVKACITDKEKLKAFITINLNLPIYNKFEKYYAEIIGYSYSNISLDVPLVIVGVTKRDENIHHSIWNTFNENDFILVKDLDKFIGYKYVTLYDIISAIENKNHPFVLDF
jgi:hypothetical protein